MRKSYLIAAFLGLMTLASPGHSDEWAKARNLLFLTTPFMIAASTVELMLSASLLKLEETPCRFGYVATSAAAAQLIVAISLFTSHLHQRDRVSLILYALYGVTWVLNFATQGAQINALNKLSVQNSAFKALFVSWVLVKVIFTLPAAMAFQAIKRLQ